MYEFLQRIFPFVFAILWIGPMVFLFLRFRRKQVAYLRRFPPIDRYQTLDMYTPGVGNPSGTYRRLSAAMWRRQEDAELERLQRELCRRYGLVALWIVGIPLVAFVAVVLLTPTGHS
jgi:hypothetical protein